MQSLQAKMLHYSIITSTPKILLMCLKIDVKKFGFARLSLFLTLFFLMHNFKTIAFIGHTHTPAV